MFKRILGAFLASTMIISCILPLEITAFSEEPVTESVAETKSENATAEPFKVLSTTPAKVEGEIISGVAVDTGIEFMFNRENVDISKSFSISPEVEGRFMTYNDRSVFVPADGLAYGTKYSVKLSKDLAAPDGSVLGEDFTLSFETEKEPPPPKYSLSLYINNNMDETFLSDDPVVLSLSAYHAKENQQYKAEAFKLTEDEYVKELYSRNRSLYNQDAIYKKPDEIKNRKAAYTVTSPLMPGLSRMPGGSRYERQSQGIIFPEFFEKGYYVIQVSAKDPLTEKTIYDQKLVQINDFATYAVSVNGGETVWVNNAKTGKPVTGKQVEIIEMATKSAKMKGVTDSQGVAAMKSSLDGAYCLLHIKSGGKDNPDYWSIVNTSYTSEKSIQEKYMFFARHDRNLYRPTDTINVWGVIRGRTSSLSPDSRFVLELREYSEGKAIKSVAVRPAADGSFSANIAISAMTSGNYYLTLREADGDKRELDHWYITVRDFTKPEYTYEAYTDKPFYMSGEQIKAGIRATFFDGTPVPGMLFSYSDEKVARTDENGEINITQKALERSSFNNTWRPRTQDISFYSESEGFVINAEAVCFPSHLIMRTDYDASAQTPVVRVLTNALDLSRMKETADIYSNYPNNFLGVKTNANIKVTIKKSTCVPVKEHTSVYYDWITKKQQTSKWYDYEWKETTISQYNAASKNGELVISNLPKDNLDGQEWSYYYVELSAQDKNGYEVRETIYLNDIYYDAAEADEICQSYYFNRINNASTEAGGRSEYRQYIAKSGENVTFRVDDRLNEKKKGKLLYMLASGGILKSEVTASREFTITQSAKYAPNINVLGAYFDGRHIYAVSPAYLEYDYSGQNLQIDMKTNPVQAKPGENMTVSVEIKDNKGRPVQSAYNIAFVDEALLALSGNAQRNPLESFFSWYRHTPYREYSSYNQYKTVAPENANNNDSRDATGYDEVDDYDSEDDAFEPADAPEANAATGGGGGEEYVRTDFKDTAQFVSGTTNSSGKAEVTIKMPDNITSWRAGIVAVSSSGTYAGENSVSLKVTQQMFLQISSSDSYVPDEDAGISLRARGAGITSTTPVSYSVELKDNNGKVLKTVSKSGISGTSLTINFGRLPTGNYKVLARGNAKGLSDAVETPFVVGKKEAYALPIIKEIQLTSKDTTLDISPSRYPVTVNFNDARFTPYLDASSYILNKERKTAKGAIASITAVNYMVKYEERNKSDYSKNIENLNNYIVKAGDGGKGVALYSYDSPTPELTAMAILLADDLISKDDKKSMVVYLKACAKGSSADSVAAAYMGLAALGESVLADVRALAKNAANNSIVTNSYLCASLNILKDSKGAGELYKNHVAPIVKNDEYMGAGKDLTKVYTNTAAALVAASAVKSKDARTLSNYLVANDTPYYSPVMELALYVKAFPYANSGSAKVSYTSGGKTQTVTLERHATSGISVSEKELKNFSMKATSGEVLAKLSYTGSLDEAIKNTPQRNRSLVTIGKTIRPTVASDLRSEHSEGSQNAAIAAGTLGNYKTIEYTVRLKTGAQAGQYSIYDRIPSSLRFYNLRNELTVGGTKQETYTYLGRNEKQNIVVSFGYDGQYYNSQWVNDSSGGRYIYTEIIGDGLLKITVVCQIVYDGAWDSQTAVLQNEDSGYAWLSGTLS